MADIAIIVNPKSASGRTARDWNRLVPHVPQHADVCFTDAPGRAIELTAHALRTGARTILAVGGDGTVNEVVNGIFASGAPTSEIRLAVVPCGTSSDLCRSLAIPGDAVKAAELLRMGNFRKIDAMHVRYAATDGRMVSRYALNVVSFGMGGVVAARTNWTRFLGGRLSFLAAIGLTAFSYSSKTVSIRLDEGPPLETRITNVAVGNGRFHGAGMCVCPNAALDDGLLDVTVIGPLSMYELARDIGVLYNGRLCSHARVQSYRARRIEADSGHDVMIEIDGEPVGRLPVEISVIPEAIQIACQACY